MNARRTQAASFRHFVTAVCGHTLTEPQEALVRIAFDREQPATLPGHLRDVAAKLFGDVDSIPAEAFHVLALLKGARVGGTWLASLYLLWRALVADLSGLQVGEVGFAIIVAPDVRTGRQALRYCIGQAQAVPAIARLIESETADTLMLRRDDGRRVAIEVLPASRGGSSLRGRSIIAALMDESAFFRDAASGVINDDEVFRAIVVRITAGGALLVVSTAWLRTGRLMHLIDANWGSPKSALAAVAPTLFMRPDAPHLAQVVEDERERDPANAAREFECQPFEGDANDFFAPAALAGARTDGPLILPPKSSQVAFAGIDVAFKRDASALVVVRRDGPVIEVCEVVELKPSPGQPLVPSEVVTRFVKCAKYHRARQLIADQYYIEAVREHARGSGLRLVTAPSGQGGKEKTYVAAQQALHEGRVLISSHQKKLLRQLSEVRSQPTPGGGLRLTSPRRPGAHGDVSSAFVNAVWAATQRSGAPLQLITIRGI